MPSGEDARRYDTSRGVDGPGCHHHEVLDERLIAGMRTAETAPPADQHETVSEVTVSAMHTTVDTLLLVEDDDVLGDAITRKLQRLTNCLLHTTTGTTALNIVDERDPDMILLDLMLPDMPGEEVLAQVREQSATPVIIISSKSEEADRINGLQSGADDYITKPLSLRELEARVRSLMRRFQVAAVNGRGERAEPPQSHSTLSYAGVKLDLASREVWLEGQPIEVTPTEFKLLRVLVERGGAAASPEQIIHRVWGYDGYDSHIVESNIYRLRTKLEGDSGERQRLVTVRGFGYKLQDVHAE